MPQYVMFEGRRYRIGDNQSRVNLTPQSFDHIGNAEGTHLTTQIFRDGEGGMWAAWCPLNSQYRVMAPLYDYDVIYRPLN